MRKSRGGQSGAGLPTSLSANRSPHEKRAASDWLTYRDGAKAFDKAEKALKSLIEPDVGKAFGAGVVATRNKAGAISIRAAK